MNIAGFQKSSFVDFPGIISCVVFTPGCNMRCGYCHNKHILSADAPKTEVLDVMDYLNKRKSMLKGVVVSGGEPTLQSGLEAFVASVKALGYKVKLDTNGTNPDVVKLLCKKGYIDYVAMDIKANIEKYSLVAGRKIDTEKVLETVEFLKQSGVAHEFRTTFCPGLTSSDILDISQNIVGESDYYLQQYRQVEGEGAPHSREYVKECARLVTENGGKCVIRGL
ncbi:MAG: anaerobic ribonucleoside-triphosphate reductase activating protein [Clostridia bacterium]|nr:anaerobic ribonucleoside-triphosphate reductase activating protein [Clostridia bacterium]